MCDLRSVPVALVELPGHQHRAPRREEVVDHPAYPQRERSARGFEFEDVAQSDPEVVREVGRHDRRFARRQRAPHVGHGGADERPALEPRIEEETRVDRVYRDGPVSVVPVDGVFPDDQRHSRRLLDLPYHALVQRRLHVAAGDPHRADDQICSEDARHDVDHGLLHAVGQHPEPGDDGEPNTERRHRERGPARVTAEGGHRQPERRARGRNLLAEPRAAKDLGERTGGEGRAEG